MIPSSFVPLRPTLRSLLSLELIDELAPKKAVTREAAQWEERLFGVTCPHV
jgi:hypothetical protein